MLIADQSKAVFDAAGLIIPVRSCSLMIVLAKLGTASASDLARELDHSHQLVLQKIPKLIRQGLIAQSHDDDDARRRLFRLTDLGAAQLQTFERCTERIVTAYRGLFEEVGDIRRLVDRTVAALQEKPLDERI